MLLLCLSAAGPQVCFAMFMPDLIRNFLYTRHNSGCIVIDVIMALVSSELHCTRTFSRRFFWTGEAGQM